MDTKTEDNSESSQANTSGVILSEAQQTAAVTAESENLKRDLPSGLSPTRISSWAKNLKISQPFVGTQDGSPNANAGKSSFSRFTSGIGLQLSPKDPSPDASDKTSIVPEPGLFGSLTKGFVESSRSAVKAVQAKARHAVSQNKRRYQEGEFDLDMTYITENIIAMGFPAGDMSSGFFGYVEGLYRNHMEEVIKFFETHHKDKYKVYNLCSERLYDASLFEGKLATCNICEGSLEAAFGLLKHSSLVASFPFDDHNCPPARLIISFCQSAYSWLKEDIENVVVVHCKAGMARTGLMISSLLLYLKFFPTAEESIDYYNQKRCFDGKGLILPSQIRYVKYFERILTYFNGENPPGRRCMLRGFRLHRCPYWIRPSVTVSDHNARRFLVQCTKERVMVFALPGEPGLTELVGDFKIHFHDRQGDFYCWLNTTMTENRKVLNTNDLDGFDKRKLPSPGFQVEVVLVDYNGSIPTKPDTTNNTKNSDERSSSTPAPIDGSAAPPKPTENAVNEDKDDVFSDCEADEGGSSKSKQGSSSTSKPASAAQDQVVNLTRAAEEVSLRDNMSNRIEISSVPKSDGRRDDSVQEAPTPESEFKAMAADASVFTFGDEEDYESD